MVIGVRQIDKLNYTIFRADLDLVNFMQQFLLQFLPRVRSDNPYGECKSKNIPREMCDGWDESPYVNWSPANRHHFDLLAYMKKDIAKLMNEDNSILYIPECMGTEYVAGANYIIRVKFADQERHADVFTSAPAHGIETYTSQQ